MFEKFAQTYKGDVALDYKDIEEKFAMKAPPPEKQTKGKRRREREKK